MLTNEKDIILFLNTLSEKQNLINRAIKYCRQIINSEDPPFEEYCSYNFIDKNNFTKEDIKLEFYSQSLHFKNSMADDFVFIDTKINMFTNKIIAHNNTQDLYEIGYYRLLTLLDGSVYDDYFVIH